MSSLSDLPHTRSEEEGLAAKFHDGPRCLHLGAEIPHMLQSIRHFSVHFGFEELLAFPDFSLNCLDCIAESKHLPLLRLFVVHHEKRRGKVRMLLLAVKVFDGH